MAKYVCDFEQVYQIGEKVCEIETELETDINTYSTNMDSDLDKWSGEAKNAFTDTKGKQVESAQQDFTYMKELGEFIKTSAKNIENLEGQLSNIAI